MTFCTKCSGNILTLQIFIQFSEIRLNAELSMCSVNVVLIFPGIIDKLSKKLL